VRSDRNTNENGGDEKMRFVVIVEWKAEDVPKIVEARSKYPIPKEITFHVEGVLFGQHKSILIMDSPDEKTLFKWYVPFVRFCTFKTIAAANYEDAIKIVTGK
jgi:hypothetical protein